MGPSASDHSKMAAFYERVADDERASRQARQIFVRKVNWLHILARLEEKKRQTGENAESRQQTNPTTANVPEALLFSPTRLAAAGRKWGVREE